MLFLFFSTPLRGNDAATCLPSFVFASANFAVVLRFTEVEKIRKGMQTETATSAWGYTTSVRGNDAATSYFIRKKIFPIEDYLKISRKVIKPT